MYTYINDNNVLDHCGPIESILGNEASRTDCAMMVFSAHQLGYGLATDGETVYAYRLENDNWVGDNDSVLEEIAENLSHATATYMDCFAQGVRNEIVDGLEIDPDDWDSDNPTPWETPWETTDNPDEWFMLDPHSAGHRWVRINARAIRSAIEAA